MTEHVFSPEERIAQVESIVRQNPEIAGIQAYEYFRSDVNKQKPTFIDGSQQDLSLSYVSLDRASVAELAVKAEETLRLLMPAHDEKAEALYNTIEYRYAEMFMIAVAGDMQNEALSQEERQEARDWFVRSSEALCGAPNPEIFNALLEEHFQPLLAKQLESGQSAAAEIQVELGSLLGDVSGASYELFKPDQTTIDRIQKLINQRLGFVIDHIDEDRVYTAQDMVPVLDTALDKIGGKDLGWQVKVVPNSTVLAVSAHQKLVEVGEDRKESKGNELKGKVLHEIGVHAQRSINAEKAGWLSAAYGQEGYLDFEEAFATALEDAFHGKFADHGVDYYVIAGLAYGLDNSEPRDFRETYEVVWRQKALKLVKDGADLTEEQIDKAKANAFTACVRLFRGTSTRDKGVVYLKDLAYYKGQELAWSVLADVHQQADLDPLFAGKLDLTKSSHQQIAQRILETSR